MNNSDSTVFDDILVYGFMALVYIALVFAPVKMKVRN